MKRVILIFATVTMAFHGQAQDKYVTSALTALKENNLEEAKENIDKAMASPETKEKPKALLGKAQIYFAMQSSDKYKADHPYREATQALMKLAELKPEYEKEAVDQDLLVGAYNYFNDGAKANNDKKFVEAADYMKNVVAIHDINGGKRFTNTKVTPERIRQFDTLSASAIQIIANSTYYQQKYEEAIPLLIKAKNNPITKSATIYACLIDAYTKQKNTTEAYAVTEEGRKAYPDDVTLRNYELNYYITSGKQEDLIKKLEEASVKEPNNPDIVFNLATTYLSMASPKDGKRPANADELTANAEDAFARALKIAPDNAGYNYNFGALYYNQATELNNAMNAITGQSAADLKKYDDLKAKRDVLFGKSMPYFEKAYTVLSANENNLKGEDMSTYKSTLLALREVYARQNKNDKSAEMKKKYEGLPK